MKKESRGNSNSYGNRSRQETVRQIGDDTNGEKRETKKTEEERRE